jgi:hypothetical protein
LTTSHLRPSQPAAASDHRSFGPCPHGPPDGLLHSSPEGNPSFQLLSDVLSDKIGIQIRLLDFLNLKADPFTSRQFLYFTLQGVDAGPLTPDNYARLGSPNGYGNLFGETLYFNAGNASPFHFTANQLADRKILVQQLSVLLPLSVPPSLPILDDAYTKTIRMYFSPQLIPPYAPSKEHCSLLPVILFLPL